MRRGAVLRLLRFPGLLFAIAAGALILGTVSASAPVFLSSVGSLTLHRYVEQASEDELPALVVTIDSTPASDVIAYRTRLLERELDGVLGTPIVTARGDQVTAAGPHGSSQVRIVTRSDALAHVEVVERGQAEGVWLADFTADALGLAPGDRVSITGSAGAATIPVAGVYADLLRQPRTPFWSTLDDFIYPSATDNTRPPAFVLMELDTYVDLEARLHDDQDVLSWEFPLPTGPRSLDDARATVGAIARLRSRLSNVALDVGSAFGRVNTTEPYSGWVAQADDVVAAIEGPVQTLSLAGRAIGLALLAGAGIFMVRRRRIELAVLRVRGVGPVRAGARTAAETLVPVALGTALGWIVAVAVVRAAEPTATVAAASVRSAAWAATTTGVLGVALLAVVSGRATSDRGEHGLDRARRAASRIPWDVLLLGAAALAFLGLREQGSGDGAAATELDRLLLLFPILFIAGAAGLAARGLRWLVPWMRRTGSRLRVAPYLASRRLAAAPSQAATLLVGATVAIGILVYAGTVTASIDATATQEGSLAIGSDASIVYTGPDPVLGDATFAATAVVRFQRASFAGTDEDLDVLAVDGPTFAHAAYWQSQFASEPLDALIDQLGRQAEGRLPLLLVGSIAAPDDAVLDVSGYDLPVSVAATPRTFPGIVGDRPLAVVDRAVLEDALAERSGSIDRMAHSSEVWARASEEDLLAFAGAQDTTVIASSDAAELRSTPAHLALSSMLRFLAATGGLAAVVVLLGTHLYLQARQRQAEASYALLRRMGLSRDAHRRSVALELLGLLFVAFSIGGGLAIIASLLVNADLQTGPLDASVTLFRAPLVLLASTAGALVVASWAGAMLVQRRADRTNVAEVMRVAG
jgi:putative ABC transport system permease protein